MRKIWWCGASLLGGMSKFSAIRGLYHPPNKENFVQGRLGVRIQGSFRSVPKTTCFAKTLGKFIFKKCLLFAAINFSVLYLAF